MARREPPRISILPIFWEICFSLWIARGWSPAARRCSLVCETNSLYAGTFLATMLFLPLKLSTYTFSSMTCEKKIRSTVAQVLPKDPSPAASKAIHE
ncbi:hypothetical protein C8R43DRAFT_609893 [Mycena crocata]|nr:hypothetical protein C8R43DRAFT_609893 [Mycena crocata]